MTVHAAPGAPPSPASATALDALVDALAEALADECRALASGHLEGLHDAVARKAQVLTDLAPRLRSASPTLRTLLAPALDAARRSNEDNARLLAARMVPHRARLDALLAAARPAGVEARPTGIYAATGRSDGPAVTRARVAQA